MRRAVAQVMEALGAGAVVASVYGLAGLWWALAAAGLAMLAASMVVAR